MEMAAQNPTADLNGQYFDITDWYIGRVLTESIAAKPTDEQSPVPDSTGIQDLAADFREPTQVDPVSRPDSPCSEWLNPFGSTNSR